MSFLLQGQTIHSHSFLTADAEHLILRSADGVW
jgi:hypothetical protein